MKILVPIYPENHDEELLLGHKIDGIQLAFLVVEHLQLLNNAEIHVFTPPNAIWDYSSYANVFHHRQSLGRQQDNRLEFLPPGATESISCIMQQFNDTPDTTFLIVDYRNASLTADLINQAHKFYLEAPQTPLISVHLAEDNPVQFEAYFRIIAMDVLCLLDKKISLDASTNNISDFLQGNEPDQHHERTPQIYLTKPAPFPWAAHGFASGIGDKQFFARLTTSSGYKFIPARKFIPSEFFLNCHPSFYFKESPNTARRLLQAVEFITIESEEVAGIPIFTSFENIFCLLTTNKDNRSFSVFLHESFWHEDDMEIRLSPFSVYASSSQGSDAVVRRVPAQRPPSILQWQGSIFYGPTCTVENHERTDGFLLSVVSRTTNEKADFAEPLILPDFWDVVADGSRRINKSTGQEITGRQAYPNIYQPNSSFVFLPLHGAQHLEQEILAGNTRGFPLHPAHSSRIHSEFDFLCLGHAQPERVPYVS
jgi:hypothetical protein